MGLEQQVSELIGEIKGWEIPKFKSEVFARLRDLETKILHIDGERIRKMEEQIEKLEINNLEKRGMWKLIVILISIISGTGIISFFCKYIFGGR